MSYEKEVAELWKEWKKSTEKYEKAIEDGYDVDADMWANDVETIHRQINLYERAAKADEYEAKAKAWDLLKLKLDGKNKSILSNPKASDEDLDFVGNNTAVLWEMSDLEMKFRKEQESERGSDE